LKHVPGTKMEIVDRLSRKPDWNVEMENTNENQKLMKEKWIREMTEIVVKGLETLLVENIKEQEEKMKK